MPHSTNTARPLLGKRILVTRTREQASSFSDRLRRMRERNRQVEQEIVSFEGELERVRRWLRERS